MHTAVSEITQKNEIKASVATGTEAFGIQGSYALTKSIGVIGGFSWGSNDVFSLSEDAYLKNGTRTNWELGIGYYHPISPVVTFEVFGGIDRFHRDYIMTDFNYSDTAVFNFTKTFIQTDIGFLNKKKNGLGLSCKFGYDIYDHSFFIHGDEWQYPYMHPYIRTSFQNFYQIEPSLTWRFGWRKLNFQVQTGYYFQNNKIIPSQDYVFKGYGDDNWFIDFGLCLHLFTE